MTYPVVNGSPVLIVRGHPLFPPGAYRDSKTASTVGRSWLRGRGASVNLSFDRCLREMRSQLADGAHVLILGAGTQRSSIQERLGPTARLLATDIDDAADVDAWCDAHDLPFRDAVFDAVITTAVLEHVLRPDRVMAELERVVRAGGLVYSEVPFMQQVHEGAYDFTRFTLSGHRRLMSGFDEISTGATAGPGTALVWSLEHFALALTGGRARRLVKALVRLAFGWIRVVDGRIAATPAALDGASCTYFYGVRRSSGRVPDDQIVRGYRGAQSLRHL